jgi:hypothetical protein
MEGRSPIVDWLLLHCRELHALQACHAARRAARPSETNVMIKKLAKSHGTVPSEFLNHTSKIMILSPF